jgi:two-component system NtrC family sensor kinase
MVWVRETPTTERLNLLVAFLRAAYAFLTLETPAGMTADPLREARILVVDDEPTNVLLIERLLEQTGYAHVVSTTDSRRTLPLYREFAPDLVLLDLMMPHLDGLAVLELLGTEIPADAYVPVLVLTADATQEAKRRALQAGARDFLTKPFEQFELLLRVRNLLETRRLHVALETHNRALEATVRQRTEQLLQSEKIATMGSLLAGVAHELNNPLAVLSGQAQLLQGQGQDPAIVRRTVKIGEAADRCVRIVRNFLALARQRPPERTHTSLKQVVQAALELLAYELRSDNVEVVIDLATDLPVLWADPHQLHQVLVNLAGNAHHAMRRRPPPRRITLQGRFERERGRVRLTMTDTGPGIPAEIQARIFEAFFTTKPAGEGTGLGLSLCRSIVEEHGGSIAMESTEGAGTTFIIELPVTAPPAGRAGGAAAETVPAVGPRRILIVDDEIAIADVVAEAVELDGHTADIATNGLHALEMLSRQTYDAVISDTKMPLLDGESFYTELVRRFPRLSQRIVFVTGDVLSREKREFLAQTGAPFLAKPFDLDEVRRTVHRVLAQPPRP